MYRDNISSCKRTIFYAKDNAYKNKHVVLQAKRKIVDIEGVTDEEEVKKGYQKMAHFRTDVDLTIFEEFMLWELGQGGREFETTPPAYKYMSLVKI